MENEYKDKCDKCGNSGDQMFARIFHRKVNNIWIYLCSSCWDKINEKINK